MVKKKIFIVMLVFYVLLYLVVCYGIFMALLTAIARWFFPAINEDVAVPFRAAKRVNYRMAGREAVERQTQKKKLASEFNKEKKQLK